MYHRCGVGGLESPPLDPAFDSSLFEISRPPHYVSVTAQEPSEQTGTLRGTRRQLRTLTLVASILTNSVWPLKRSAVVKRTCWEI